MSEYNGNRVGSASSGAAGSQITFSATDGLPRKKRKLGAFKLLLCITLLLLVVFIVLITIEITSSSKYEKATMQDYGTAEYSEIFGTSSAPEDNLLLVFLADKEHRRYSTKGFAGSNVAGVVADMLDEREEYEDAVAKNINKHGYRDTLDEDYVNIIESFTDAITQVGTENNFRSPSDRSNLVPSSVINKTGIDFDEDRVNRALAELTEKTGICCVLIIDYESNVYTEDFASGVNDAAVAVIILLIFMLPVLVVVGAVNFFRRIKLKWLVKAQNKTTGYTEG